MGDTSIEWTEKTVDRFWSYVDRSGGPDACWPWTGARQHPGYGKLRVSKRSLFAHRIAVFLAAGAWPGPVVMHTCDNPPCCNPAHLRSATQAENMADCKAKGRLDPPRGERCARARLTKRDVESVRARLAAGASLRAIAREFGVGHTTIANIKLGHTWRAA